MMWYKNIDYKPWRNSRLGQPPPSFILSVFHQTKNNLGLWKCKTFPFKPINSDGEFSYKKLVNSTIFFFFFFCETNLSLLSSMLSSLSSPLNFQTLLLGSATLVITANVLDSMWNATWCGEHLDNMYRNKGAANWMEWSLFIKVWHGLRRNSLFL